MNHGRGGAVGILRNTLILIIKNNMTKVSTRLLDNGLAAFSVANWWTKNTAMEDILVKSLMSKQVVCTHAHADVTEVARTMHEHSYSCLVVTERDLPIGVITERDMVSILVGVLKTTPSRLQRASEFMSSPPVVINARSPLFEALVLSQSQKIRHLPVVNDDGRLIGLVTQSDLAKAHLHLIETQRDIIEHSVAERTRELEDANEQLKALSLEDALLEIGNRRAMEVDLKYTHESALRYQRPYSIALLDVDCFKLYNDYYGHAAGDCTLKEITAYLKSMIRRSDRLYRYGGEELLLLLPETRLEGAEVLARRLVEGLAACKIPHCKSPFNVVTMSGGVGCEELAGGATDKDWQDVAARADQALYRAKGNGRNQLAVEKLEKVA